MYSINKFTASCAIDFAACELKKYLRMMMPESGDIKISYAPDATGGFRLGLMQDLGLDVSDAEDVALDDIIYIDCDISGGIIAGDNPRSVLLAVYEYLRQNGCRWLFPGVDGEYIPMQNISPVKYRHKPSLRHRGPCIEGATSQRVLLDTIDFIPKAGMNMFMMQFFVPTPFFNEYYNHRHNVIREKESVSYNTMLQWKMRCESEMAMRGIAFHDVGHGWAAEPFGIDTSSGWDAVDPSIVPDDAVQYLALVGGKRGLHKGRVLTTQFCLSNPEARAKVVSYVLEYCKKHSNVDYLYVSLADGQNNHCECSECVTKTVSDWYVILLNELDAVLSAAGISTKISFTAYTETTWAPISERILNKDRFILEFAPYSRSYQRTLTEGADVVVRPFERNNITLPESLDEYVAYYREWKKTWDGSAMAFEYHFWRHMISDFSGLILARRINEDVETYHRLGISGVMACGSQRAYFPNGFAYYVFARKLFDVGASYDVLLEDYYNHAYGDGWREIAETLEKIADLIGFGYMEGEESENPDISLYYSPKRAEKIALVAPYAQKCREIALANRGRHSRVSAVSYALLEIYSEFARLAADALHLRALGDKDGAIEKYSSLAKYMSEREVYIETCYDLSISLGFIREVIEFAK